MPKWERHGKIKERIYHIYCGIKARCNKDNKWSYKVYGKNGIKCEWDNFTDFFSDMGKLYYDHVKKHGEKHTTIERKDNAKNYCKENCCWATRFEQAKNRNIVKLIEMDGQKKTLVEWAKQYGMNHNTVWGRIHDRGWTVEEAIKTPRVKTGFKFKKTLDPIYQRKTNLSS